MFGHFAPSALSEAGGGGGSFGGDAALSVLQACSLMGFIDLNNIRGCGDVIKAEITSA